MVKNVDEMSIKELEDYLKKRKAAEKAQKVVTHKKEKNQFHKSYQKYYHLLVN